MIKKWEDLPEYMQNEKVRVYYNVLKKKSFSLIVKRMFDFTLAVCLLLLLFVPMCIISIFVWLDSKGEILYRQERVTKYGKKFYIHKFRTMVVGADKSGTLVTVDGDERITNVGRFLRKYRLDELPQLIDVIKGDMSFVGTRPEVQKYVEHYDGEMFATLLLPAGITSEASIKYKDEAELLKNCQSEREIDDVYINKILPEKMKYNLQSIYRFSLLNEFKTIIKTVLIFL